MNDKKKAVTWYRTINQQIFTQNILINNLYILSFGTSLNCL